MPTIETLYQQQNGRCYYCDGPMYLPDDTRCHPHTQATRDHRIPRSKGGGEGANLVGACFRCNNAKGNMFEHEFRVNQGWLSKNPRWLQVEVTLIRARAERSERAQQRAQALQQLAPQDETPEARAYREWLVAPNGPERARCYVTLCKLRGIEVAPVLLKLAEAA